MLGSRVKHRPAPLVACCRYSLTSSWCSLQGACSAGLWYEGTGPGQVCRTEVAASGPLDCAPKELVCRELVCMPEDVPPPPPECVMESLRGVPFTVMPSVLPCSSRSAAVSGTASSAGAMMPQRCCPAALLAQLYHTYSCNCGNLWWAKWAIAVAEHPRAICRAQRLEAIVAVQAPVAVAQHAGAVIGSHLAADGLQQRRRRHRHGACWRVRLQESHQAKSRQQRWRAVVTSTATCVAAACCAATSTEMTRRQPTGGRMLEAKAGTRLPAAGMSPPYMAAYCCCVSWSPTDEPPEFRRVLFSLENTLLGGPRRLGTCKQGRQQQCGHNPSQLRFQAQS
jgi:hypothetical protein